MVRNCLVFLALVAALILWPLGAARAQTIPIEPVTGEVQVNTYTTGDQAAPSLAIDGDGDFVVVWESETAVDASVPSILAQRFDSAGGTVGDEFRVSINTAEDNLDAAVAMSAAGEFVIVWAGPGFTPGSKNLVGKLFDAAGGLVGTFQANSSSAGGVRSAAVSIAGDGSFAVAWDDGGSDETDTDGRSVHARRFDALGDPQGAPFQVNSYTTGDQNSPAVATDATGNFVVVWESDTAPGSPVGSVLARRFDSGGMGLGDELLVNINTTEDNLDAAVAMSAAGDFVVVWAGPGFTPGSKNLIGRRYDSTGGHVGTFQANLSSAGGVRSASVAIDPQGRFLVSWDDSFSADTDVAGRSVHARLFNADGAADGNSFQVNTFTSGDQRLPALAAAGGRAVVAWQSAGPDGAGTSVQGQVYGLGIFTDGFESGDVSAWSGSSP